MIRVKLAREFVLQYRDMVQGCPSLKALALERISLFKKSPGDTRLKNHALRKKMEGKWSFSVSPEIRVVYEWLGKNDVRFLMIGSHEEVYHRR